MKIERRRSRSWFALGLTGAALMLAPNMAWAAQPPPATAGGGGASADPQKLEEAKQKYTQGLKLYDDGAYDAARVQFERAYSLAPSYKILYNIGLVYKQLNEFVGSLKALQQYVKEGGSEIPADRLAEVNKIIENLKGIIASATVTVNMPGAEISVDDKVVGKSPLSEPVLLNPGRRKISAKKEGMIPDAKVIEVASLDQTSVALKLEEAKTTIVKKSDWKPVVMWTVTGAFAIGAGITSYLTLKASNDLKDAEGVYNPDAAAKNKELTDDHSKMKTFGLVSDILWAGTIISGGFAIYFTVTSSSGKEEKAPPPAEGAPPPAAAKMNVKFVPGLGGGAIVGTF